MSDVTIPSNRLIVDLVPVLDPSDLTSLSASTLMTLIQDAISGKFGLQAQIYQTYADLQTAATNPGWIYYCVETDDYYGYTSKNGLKVL